MPSPESNPNGNAGAASRAPPDVWEQLSEIRLDNEVLRQENEQLHRKLVVVSRRANAATRLAYCDGLTGLPNRLLLIKHLQRAIAEAYQRRQTLALLFIDVDGFKAVNDTYGHRTGDRLLSVIAGRIAASVRWNDIACRYGGDEFVALLKNLDDPAIAMGVARGIRDSIARQCLIEGQAIQVAATVGVAIYPADGKTYDALLSHADAAMYRGKPASRLPCALTVTRPGST